MSEPTITGRTPGAVVCLLTGVLTGVLMPPCRCCQCCRGRRCCRLPRRGSRHDLRAVARPLRVEQAVSVRAPVRVRAEEVTLGLHERRGKALGADAVVV